MNAFVNKVLFIVTLILALGFVIWGSAKTFEILLPFILGYLLSIPISKFVNYIKLKFPSIPKGIVTILSILIILGLFILLLGFFINNLIVSLNDIISETSNVSNSFYDFFDHLAAYELVIPGTNEVINLKNIMGDFYNQLTDIVVNLSSFILNSLVNVLKKLPSFAISFFFMILSIYFFTKDHDHINTSVINQLEKFDILKNERVMHFRYHTFDTFKKYIKAELLLVTITFSISTIGLLILGVSYAPLIALAIAFLDMIPMIGPAIVYVPWAIISFLFGEYSLGIGLLIVYAIATTTRQIIEPKIVSSNIGIYPLITLISIYSGYKIFGTIGFLIGMIAVLFITIAYKSYKQSKDISEQ